MTERVYRVLFLSRRNSARSVMAEAILNKIGKGRFEALSAAGEPLPQWPGMPVSAHWSSPDPAHIEGQDWEKEQGLSRIMAELERRLGIFVNLPFGALDRMSLQRSVDDIAR